MTIDQRIEFLVQSSESHDRQIGGLTAAIGELQDAVTKLVAVTNEDATAIRTLARIAEAHESGSLSWKIIDRAAKRFP